MFKIELYLKRHWGEVENLSQSERYFSIDDKPSVRDLFGMSPSISYNYGKVVIRNEYSVLLDEECELDFFVSCIQDDREEIFSGFTHIIDNSYFKLYFHYHDMLIISFKNKNISVKKLDFLNAFRSTAEKYYLMLSEFKDDGEYYKQQANQINTEWAH